jgi:hypothetical protein
MVNHFGRHLLSGRERWRDLSPVARARFVLCLLAGALSLWLVFGADHPWTIERLDREHWKLKHIVGYYSFWAAVGNLFALGGLILSARWWASPQPTAPPRSVGRSPVWFWPLTLAAMIFCGALASLRMSHGFVHDEESSARQVIAGPYKVTADGAVFLDEPDWRETLYHYRKPNNHVLHSILARLCWTAWQKIAPPVNWHLKEWVIRIPAWIGGIGAVCTLAILLRRYISPLAGVLAAWLLALHPWHLRFAAEARGYSLMLCTIPVVLYFWLRAIQENRWRWWLLFSASQFALVYFYPGSLYVLIVLNGATALWLLGNLARAGQSPAFGRWFASNCFAAMAALQLMLPLFPQLQTYLRTEEARAPIGLSWVFNTAIYFLAGVPWSKSALATSSYLELMPYATAHPLFFGAVLTAIVALILIGYAAMFRLPLPEGPIVASTLLVPGFVGFAAAKLFHQWLFEWYLLYLLPGLVAGAAVGAFVMGRWLRNRFAHRWIAMLPGLGLVLAYGTFTHPFRAWYSAHPMEPVKEATLAMRSSLDPNDPLHRHRLTGVLLSLDDYYDPRANLIRTPEDFIRLLQTSDEEGKPLSIMVHHPWAAAFQVPQLWRLFNEAGLFTEYLYFHGLDQTNDRIVAHYQRGSVRDFDLNAFLRGRPGVPNANDPPLKFPNKPVVHSAAP